MAISGGRLVLQLLVGTFCALVLIENLRFAFGIVICHTVGDISTSGLDDHIAISGCPSMSNLFVDTFFEFGVVENFVYRARITVIIVYLLQIYSAV